jgi:hypothetical protein
MRVAARWPPAGRDPAHRDSPCPPAAPVPAPAGTPDRRQSSAREASVGPGSSSTCGHDATPLGGGGQGPVVNAG